MTAPEQQPAQLEHLDPAALTSHPRNVRTDLGDLTGLTASIAAQGVLEPLTVVPLQPVGYLLIAGHRRAAAAVAAGLDRVPCMVRTDWRTDVDGEAAQIEHLGAMLAENLQRQNLTPVEEARGVQQLLDLGVSMAKVVKSTGLSRKRVGLAAGVARLSEETAVNIALAGLDLEQAAAVALFSGDQEASDQLIAAAAHGPGQFAHALERAKRDRDNAVALQKLVDELTAAGRTVLVGEERRGPGVAELYSLRGTTDGAGMTAEEHIQCPGAAVSVWPNGHTEEVCTSPAKYGHELRWGGTAAKAKPETVEEKDAAKAERRRVIDNNKAMEAANAVRRAWLREYLARKTAPKELLRFCVDTFATGRALDGWLNGLSAGGDEEAASELGLERPRSYGDVPVTLTSGEQVSDARLPLQLFAHIAAAHEVSISRESWRKRDHRRDMLVRWLTFLAAQGYTLADVEQEIVDQAKPSTTAAAA